MIWAILLRLQWHTAHLKSEIIPMLKVYHHAQILLWNVSPWQFISRDYITSSEWNHHFETLHKSSKSERLMLLHNLYLYKTFFCEGGQLSSQNSAIMINKSVKFWNSFSPFRHFEISSRNDDNRIPFRSFTLSALWSKGDCLYWDCVRDVPVWPQCARTCPWRISSVEPHTLLVVHDGSQWLLLPPWSWHKNQANWCCHPCMIHTMQIK